MCVWGPSHRQPRTDLAVEAGQGRAERNVLMLQVIAGHNPGDPGSADEPVPVDAAGGIHARGGDHHVDIREAHTPPPGERGAPACPRRVATGAAPPPGGYPPAPPRGGRPPRSRTIGA